MTSSELIGLPASELEKLTDEQLLEYFKPVLHLTRPPVNVTKTSQTLDLAKHEGNTRAPVHQRANIRQQQLSKAKEIAAQYGLEL